MAILKTEAIVLRTFDFRNTSLIAHLFSKEYGKLHGLLKGIREEPRKFGSTLEPFSSCEIVYYQKRNSELHLISQCDLKDNFDNIRKNLKGIAFASYIIDIIERLMHLEDKNEEAYKLAFSALRQMNLGYDAEKILRIFIIKFLKLIGFRPRLDGCIICDKNINESGYFNVKRGGLLCSKCYSSDTNSISILKGTIVSILHIERSHWEDALRLELNQGIKNELTDILHNFMEFHLQIKPKSKEFLTVLT